ncbi:MAG TPA: HAMP domain-containing sensor histidine kinase [Candidatus Limnocylindria bacterium]|jgi:signal transduction histidine kinase
MQRRFRAVAAIALVLVVPAIGLIDLSTGLEFSFSIFYVVPTAVAAWYIGRGLGIGVAILTGLTWGYAESAVRIASLPAATWNRGTRLLILVAFAYLVDLIRRHQEELRRLLAQRDEFLSLIAHELRAPVAAIEIVAAGLTRAPALGAAERRALAQLLEQAHGLTGLAEDLLSVAQLEAGTGRLEPENFDLRTVLSDLTDDQPRIRLILPDQPIMVHADRDAIRRAILNVRDNALKFSEATVEIGASLRSDGRAVVRVTDNGIGLEPGEIRHLFRKYGRIRNEATTHIPGVGLGLYFTRLVLAAHGGSITAISSGRGNGSTFELALPAVTGPGPQLPRGRRDHI